MWVFHSIFVRLVNLFPFVRRVVEALSKFTKSIAQFYHILLRSRLCCLSSDRNCCCLFSRGGNLFGNRLGFFFRRERLSPSFHQRSHILSCHRSQGGCRLDTWRCCGDSW